MVILRRPQPTRRGLRPLRCSARKPAQSHKESTWFTGGVLRKRPAQWKDKPGRGFAPGSATPCTRTVGQNVFRGKVVLDDSHKPPRVAYFRLNWFGVFISPAIEAIARKEAFGIEAVVRHTGAAKPIGQIEGKVFRNRFRKSNGHSVEWATLEG